MSLFDPPPQDKLTDFYPQGVTFRLLSATDEGMQETSFGVSHQAGLLVEVRSDVGETEQRWFKVWGTLADQVGQMGDDDLPAWVAIEKNGRKNVFVPKDAPGGALRVASTSDDIPF